MDRVGQPTEIQSRAWTEIAERRNVLISAPTGAGKSLAAWAPLLDRILSSPGRGRGVRVLYVSPLRALSRDMANGMLELLDHPALRSARPAAVRIGVRTGDTSARERAHQRRQPPDIMLTTPESLFVLLGSRGGRGMLATVEAVIVDEVHALIDSKRGTHLALSLERLQALNNAELQRIGLSATAKPLDQVGHYLCGVEREYRLVDWGTPQAPRTNLECPPWPIGHVAGLMHWEFIHQRLLSLAELPGTMLIFCNTRAMVERLGHVLSEQLDDKQVASHHGSLGIERRREVEQGLKSGVIRVVVCTSSLELGIDVGPLDRVCQIGMCQSINAFRQRAGRARHRPGEVGAIHVFPLNLTDLLDYEAVRLALADQDLDQIRDRPGDLDVLVQHLIAAVANGLENVSDLLGIFRRAWPFRGLEASTFDRLISMLHEGYVPGRETGQGPLIRVDAETLQAVPKADRLSLVNAGTIPEWFEYDVVNQRGRILGQLDEEFAFESSPGQVMSLGGQSWRIQQIRTGQVQVESCADEAANLPFWFGDGAGRSPDLSRYVQSIFKTAKSIDKLLQQWLAQAKSELGALPDARCIIFERFFDPGGDQHLVIHSWFGARLNRAWGLALRKRFCRNFNFELQAAATDNGVLISLGAVHSFDLEEVANWLKADQLDDVLTQAMLDTPVFQTRLRWCANTALAVARNDLRGKVPAQIQRNQTENFIARVFPDQLACLENLSGKRELPDHPLVDQALRDCLDDHMALPELTTVLLAMEQKKIRALFVDRARPSVLAEALVKAPRNSFLDPAAAEERRTRTFEQREPPRGAQAVLAQTDVDLVSREGLMQGLTRFGFLTAQEGERARAGQAFTHLLRECRAVTVKPPGGAVVWASIERLPQLMGLWPKAKLGPFISRGLTPAAASDREAALCQLVLGRVRFHAQVDLSSLTRAFNLADNEVLTALNRLSAEGLLHRCEKSGKELWSERKPELVH